MTPNEVASRIRARRRRQRRLDLVHEHLDAVCSDAISSLSEPIMSRLTEKLSRVGEMTNRVAGRLEQKADAYLAREEGINKRMDEAFAKHEQFLDERAKELAGMEAAIAGLSNLPPTTQTAGGATSGSAGGTSGTGGGNG